MRSADLASGPLALGDGETRRCVPSLASPGAWGCVLFLAVTPGVVPGASLPCAEAVRATVFMQHSWPAAQGGAPGVRG